MLPNTMQIEYLHPRELKDYTRQLRTIPETQITKAQNLIQECGFILPIPVNDDLVILHGQYMVEAARRMGIDSIPVIRHKHLTPEQERLVRLALDRIAEDGEWNKEELAAEFGELQVLIPDLTITGFEIDEINIALDILPDSDPDDAAPMVAAGPAVTQPGDLWQLGDHKLLCGDALDPDNYKALLGDTPAQMCFVDMPYNVKVDGHVGNSGKVKHDEFAMASGEMSVKEFTEFLSTAHSNIAGHCDKGAVIYSCMDWRHMREILDAGQAAGLELLNLCVWAKDNGGMGSLYRSRHELVFVFKNGKDKHINNVQLGSNGRYRTNVWQYAGVNSFGGGRMDELEMHPTVKPAAMVTDAIKDCSKRGGIILDPMGGSGTTLVAAGKSGRKARLMEIDPHYCDVTIRRWQEQTGEDAVHATTGKTFNETMEKKGKNDE